MRRKRTGPTFPNMDQYEAGCGPDRVRMIAMNIVESFAFYLALSGLGLMATAWIWA